MKLYVGLFLFGKRFEMCTLTVENTDIQNTCSNIVHPVFQGAWQVLPVMDTFQQFLCGFKVVSVASVSLGNEAKASLNQSGIFQMTLYQLFSVILFSSVICAAYICCTTFRSVVIVVLLCLYISHEQKTNKIQKRKTTGQDMKEDLHWVAI